MIIVSHHTGDLERCLCKEGSEEKEIIRDRIRRGPIPKTHRGISHESQGNKGGEMGVAEMTPKGKSQCKTPK